MADFCKQCAADLFPPDYGSDFDWVKNHLTVQDEAAGYGVAVLCEGCGPTVVNRAGECTSAVCLLEHGKRT